LKVIKEGRRRRRRRRKALIAGRPLAAVIKVVACPSASASAGAPTLCCFVCIHNKQ
jgi:hypothetical protein